jgi:hypothetical protein
LIAHPTTTFKKGVIPHELISVSWTQSINPHLTNCTFTDILIDVAQVLDQHNMDRFCKQHYFNQELTHTSAQYTKPTPLSQKQPTHTSLSGEPLSVLVVADTMSKMMFTLPIVYYTYMGSWLAGIHTHTDTPSVDACTILGADIKGEGAHCQAHSVNPCTALHKAKSNKEAEEGTTTTGRGRNTC